LIFKEKERFFVPPDRPKPIQGAKKRKFFPLNIKPVRARHIFAPDPQNPLTVASAMPCRLLGIIHQKSVSRRMDVTYDNTLYLSQIT
jgi:hypothetical protein